MAAPRPASSLHPTDRIVGQAPAIAALRAQIRHLASFDVLGNPYVPTVLLHGETGTGKGLVARVMHDSGPRAQGPFIDINCAAIPETLVEAELYGFAAGAFTDAKRAKPGLLEAASGGTLLLDEIDALPLGLQGKLLTVIEEKRVRRLGAVAERPVDVKLIVATQAELSVRVREGQFRGDLYQRLAVVLLDIPPLRDRGEDMLVLAGELLRQYAKAYRLDPKRLSAAAEGWLRAYPWPGNVRELSHLLERVMLLSAETIIDPDTLERLCLPRLQSRAPGAPARNTRAAEDDAARITQALRQTEGNVEGAARLLGLSRKAVRYRMRKYGITRSPADQKPRHPSRPLHQGTPGVPSLLMGKGESGGGEAAAFPLSPVSSRIRREEEPEVAVILAPSWEQKPVAVLALELTWSAVGEGDASPYEPWTAAHRWEQLILEKVHGFGGVCVQRSPSLLLVAFGIPKTLEQSPQRAVQAALTLRTLVVEGGDGGSCPALRQAVHWGQVLVDGGANNPTARLLPIGEALALPVRLLGQSASGEIVVSAPVGRLIEGWFALESRAGPSGHRHPDQSVAYAVLGLRPQPSPLRLQGRRPLTRFVGRARELAVLEDLLGQAQEGRGQVVGMIGEPGVGKSRLCDEFIFRPRLHGWQILATSTTAYGNATPYLPVIDLLKAYFQLEEQDAVPTLREKITAKLQTLDAAFEPSLPAFLSLLDIPVDEPAWQALDPPQRRRHTLDALKRLLLWESHVQPLLLVVENLHWLDGETQALLETLIDSLPAARLLLLVTYRPEYRHVWGSKTSYTQIRLDPLSAQHAQDLLGSLLGEDPSLTQFTPRLIAQTEGNPFFLEESVRTLIETHVLAGAPGAYRLAQAVQHIQVPATVHMVLAARIDRLSAEAKHLLQTAAVIGKDVPLPLLLAVAEGPEAVVHQSLTALQAAEFLYEGQFVPELVCTFKHALTHEVAYGSLLPERRRALHARIVGALEALVGERLTEHIERLAHHALRGEVWDKAVTYCQQAGAKAYDRAAFREAVAYFGQALGHLPEPGDTGGLAIELRLALGRALTLLGEYKRCLALLREAEALARARDDRARLGRVLDSMAEVLRLTADYEGAMAAARQALALAAALGESALQGQASFHLGQAYYAIGDFGRAAELLRQSMEAADRESGTPNTGWRIVSQAWLARTLSDLGAFAEGRRHGEEALRLATLEGRGVTPIVAHACLGRVYHAQGDLEAAIRVLEQGLALCRASGTRSGWLRMIMARLGYAYALQGRLAEGRALLEEAIEEDIRTGAQQGYANWLAWFSEVCRLAGRGDEAWQHARQAVDLARQHKERANEALALHQLGTVHAHADPPDVAPAEAHYQQALALAEALGMRPLVAHCHLGLGTLYATIGRRAEARAELSAAIDLYRAMDMTFWLPQAAAALAQVEGR